MMNRHLLGYSKHEVLVRNYALTLALILVLSALGTACPIHRGNPSDKGPATQTQTIAPAVAQPAPTGTDSMTQTVDVEDSRSEDDGGSITNPKTGTSSKSPAKSKPDAKPVPVKKH
jgi:hypothetical protein